MSHLEIIGHLCSMLDTAQKIIREQADLLAQHGIETDNGELERTRAQLLKDVENST